MRESILVSTALEDNKTNTNAETCKGKSEDRNLINQN